jgi:hypothetical protein
LKKVDYILMDEQSTLEIDSLSLMRNLARVSVRNSLIYRVKVLPIKSGGSMYQRLMRTFLDIVNNEMESRKCHADLRVEVVPDSYLGFSVNLGYHISENRVPVEASDFFYFADPEGAIDTFYRKVGGSPLLIKSVRNFPEGFSLDEFAEIYSEELLFNAKLFKEYGVHIKHFDKSIARNVSRRMLLDLDQINYLGQVLRGDLVELDYLSGRDYNPSNVKNLATTLLDKCRDRLNTRIKWLEEDSKPREPVISHFIRRFNARYPAHLYNGTLNNVPKHCSVS